MVSAALEDCFVYHYQLVSSLIDDRLSLHMPYTSLVFLLILPPRLPPDAPFFLDAIETRSSTPMDANLSFYSAYYCCVLAFLLNLLAVISASNNLKAVCIILTSWAGFLPLIRSCLNFSNLSSQPITFLRTIASLFSQLLENLVPLGLLLQVELTWISYFSCSYIHGTPAFSKYWRSEAFYLPEMVGFLQVPLTKLGFIRAPMSYFYSSLIHICPINY